MPSAALRKSITDLTRRRGRTALAVATLALAVASISFLAVPTLVDRSMQAELRRDRLADVTLALPPMRLDAAQLARLAAVPNVVAVEPRSSVETRVLVGERRAPARVIGVRDFAHQQVDRVRLAAGRTPGEGEVLADVQDAGRDLLGARAGDTIRLADGGTLAVTGQARNIAGSRQVAEDSVIVLYATPGTVAALAGERGWRRLALRLRDNHPAAQQRTIEAVRRELKAMPGFTGFTALPAVRAPGDWPGKDDMRQFADFFGVVTFLALLSALVLISNTMSTLVAEQTGEIGIMRAVGARRRQVARVYVTTAVLLGALGALAGAALGVALSSVLARYFGQTFWGVDAGFGVDPPILALSVATGLLGPALAALPAVRRGMRTDLREALESTGSAIGGQGVVDHALRRLRFLPRTMQIGVRGAGRRKRRSLATIAIVALAVGNLLAILGLASAVTDTTRAEWRDHLEDVRIWTTGRKGFDANAAGAIRATPGVAQAQPALVADVRLGSREAFVWGVERKPLLHYRLSAGRWFTGAEERGRELVAVIERNLANAAGVRAGDDVTIATAAGQVRLRIVGVARNQQENGTTLFVPLSSLRAWLGTPDEVSTYWIRTSSPEHAFVDHTTNLLEDRLAALGYDMGSEITYVATRDNVEENKTVTTSIAVLGLLIVAISMVGLASALTTSVVERTREIGVLRCIGARARDVRRIFTAEGLVLALAGWLAGIPVGYLFDRGLVWLVKEIVEVDVPVAFPPGHVLLALAGTIVLALAIISLPIRRAVRYRPGDALRYG